MDKADEEAYRYLLLGKIGSGKSSTGNTILGENVFRTGIRFTSVTSDCERKVSYRGTCRFEVMDCPGLFNIQNTHEETSTAIVQAVAGMHPGPHAILYVIRLGRYTLEEFETYQHLKCLLDDSITRHMIIVFTGGDLLEQEGISLEDLIYQDMPKELQQVIRECDGRYILFNNMAENKLPQVESLVAMVKRMMAENNNQPYTCPKYSSVGQSLEEEVARRLEKMEKEKAEQIPYVEQLKREAEEAKKTKEQAEKEVGEMKQKMEEERQKHRKEERARQREEERKRSLEKDRLEQEKERLAREKDKEKWDFIKQTMKDQRQKESERMKREAEQKQLAFNQKFPKKNVSVERKDGFLAGGGVIGSVGGLFLGYSRAERRTEYHYEYK